MQTLTITRPDDWHVHLRDDDKLIDTVAATAKHFQRALIMPNLHPPLITVADLLAYRARIAKHIPADNQFQPLMTLYLTTSTNPAELLCAKNESGILGAKLYPAGATTNSESGVNNLKSIYHLLELMQQYDLVLQLHGEVTYGDIFEREQRFLTESLTKILKNFPKLRIVLEHISTAAAVDFVQAAPPTLAATITPQHLLYNRNHLLAGGIRPHYYCLPILKHEQDMHALRSAAISGNPKFFAGTDSAPHIQDQKENSCGCAGVYSAPYAISLYAQLFDELGKLSALDAFLGKLGAQFYQMPQNTRHIILHKQSRLIAANLPLGKHHVVPIAAGDTVHWSVYATC